MPRRYTLEQQAAAAELKEAGFVAQRRPPQVKVSRAFLGELQSAIDLIVRHWNEGNILFEGDEDANNKALGTLELKALVLKSVLEESERPGFEKADPEDLDRKLRPTQLLGNREH